MAQSLRNSHLLLGCKNHESIDTFLTEKYNNGELNGNVLVVKNDETLYKKSFGYADGAKTTLLTKDHRFNIGSVYKEFPAVAIMQLQEQNLLNVEDKIVKYLPELPKWAEKVSIKHLLQYASGLPKINWGKYFSKGINLDDAYIFNEIQNIETLAFEPGSDYLYTNCSPILLIKIVEQVSKLPFNNYLKSNIFLPYQLKNITLSGQYPYKDKMLMAIPFDTNFKEDDYKISVKSLLFSSTTQDMYRWLKLIGDFEIIDKQSVKFLSQEAKVGDNIQTPLGSCSWENDKIIEHAHHGSSGNYECLVRRFKQEGITIVILTNQKRSNVHNISDEIYKMVKRDF